MEEFVSELCGPGVVLKYSKRVLEEPITFLSEKVLLQSRRAQLQNVSTVETKRRQNSQVATGAVFKVPVRYGTLRARYTPRLEKNQKYGLRDLKSVRKDGIGKRSKEPTSTASEVKQESSVIRAQIRAQHTYESIKQQALDINYLIVKITEASYEKISKRVVDALHNNPVLMTEVFVQLTKQINFHPQDERDVLSSMVRILKRIDVEKDRALTAREKELKDKMREEGKKYDINAILDNLTSKEINDLIKKKNGSGHQTAYDMYEDLIRKDPIAESYSNLELSECQSKYQKITSNPLALGLLWQLMRDLIDLYLPEGITTDYMLAWLTKYAARENSFDSVARDCLTVMQKKMEIQDALDNPQRPQTFMVCGQTLSQDDLDEEHLVEMNHALTKLNFLGDETYMAKLIQGHHDTNHYPFDIFFEKKPTTDTDKDSACYTMEGAGPLGGGISAEEQARREKYHPSAWGFMDGEFTFKDLALTLIQRKHRQLRELDLKNRRKNVIDRFHGKDPDDDFMVKVQDYPSYMQEKLHLQLRQIHNQIRSGIQTPTSGLEAATPGGDAKLSPRDILYPGYFDCIKCDELSDEMTPLTAQGKFLKPNFAGYIEPHLPESSPDDPKWKKKKKKRSEEEEAEIEKGRIVMLQEWNNAKIPDYSGIPTAYEDPHKDYYSKWNWAEGTTDVLPEWVKNRTWEYHPSAEIATMQKGMQWCLRSTDMRTDLYRSPLDKTDFKRKPMNGDEADTTAGEDMYPDSDDGEQDDDVDLAKTRMKVQRFCKLRNIFAVDNLAEDADNIVNDDEKRVEEEASYYDAARLKKLRMQSQRQLRAYQWHSVTRSTQFQPRRDLDLSPEKLAKMTVEEIRELMDPVNLNDVKHVPNKPEIEKFRQADNQVPASSEQKQAPSSISSHWEDIEFPANVPEGSLLFKADLGDDLCEVERRATKFALYAVDIDVDDGENAITKKARKLKQYHNQVLASMPEATRKKILKDVVYYSQFQENGFMEDAVLMRDWPEERKLNVQIICSTQYTKDATQDSVVYQWSRSELTSEGPARLISEEEARSFEAGALKCMLFPNAKEGIEKISADKQKLANQFSEIKIRGHSVFAPSGIDQTAGDIYKNVFGERMTVVAHYIPDMMRNTVKGSGRITQMRGDNQSARITQRLQGLKRTVRWSTDSVTGLPRQGGIMDSGSRGTLMLRTSTKTDANGTAKKDMLFTGGARIKGARGPDYSALANFRSKMEMKMAPKSMGMFGPEGNSPTETFQEKLRRDMATVAKEKHGLGPMANGQVLTKEQHAEMLQRNKAMMLQKKQAEAEEAAHAYPPGMSAPPPQIAALLSGIKGSAGGPNALGKGKGAVPRNMSQLIEAAKNGDVVAKALLMKAKGKGKSSLDGGGKDGKSG